MHFPSGCPAPLLAGAHARRCSDFPPLDMSRSGRPSTLVWPDDSSAGTLADADYKGRRRRCGGLAGALRSSISAPWGLTTTRSNRADMASLAMLMSCPVTASINDIASPRGPLLLASAARAPRRFASGNVRLTMLPWPEATDLNAFMNSRSAVAMVAAFLAEGMGFSKLDPARERRPDLASCNNWSRTIPSSSVARQEACPSTLSLPGPAPPGHS